MFAPVVPARTLTADVASQIEAMIRDGRLSAGERLPPEHELITSLSVSRTVLREAVAALRAQGLLTSRRGAGVFVSALPPTPPFRLAAEDLAALPHALALLEFRAGLEVECAGLAALRRSDEQAQAIRTARLAMREALQNGASGVQADADFHMAIAHASQNPHFAEFLSYLRTVSTIPRAHLHGADRTVDHPDHRASPDARYAVLLDEVHARIELAITAQNADAAREAMRQHFRVAAERYSNRAVDA
jgi:GntR family transcriptional regulator, transcriptional repressor for pyruvate dehydrogenase complex